MRARPAHSIRDRQLALGIEVRMHGCNLYLHAVANESLANRGRPCMIYAAIPRRSRYSTGLRESSETLIRVALYQRMKESTISMK
jgi:hypothetical protein